MSAENKMGNTFFIIMIIIALIFGIFPMTRFLYTNVYPYVRDNLMQDAVLKSGISTNAKVIKSLQTSTWSGNKPVYKLTFRFETKDDHVVESTIMKALTFKEIEILKEGGCATIKYDPKDPRRIAVSNKPLILGE